MIPLRLVQTSGKDGVYIAISFTWILVTTDLYDGL